MPTVRQLIRKPRRSKKKQGKAPALGLSFNALKNRADIELARGNNAIAVQFYKQIIHILEKDNSPHNIELAISYNKLGEILLGINELEMARIYFDKSIQIYENNLLEEQRLLINSLKNIKNIYEIEEHFDLVEYTDSLIEST